jgi:hypothetical protein
MFPVSGAIFEFPTIKTTHPPLASVNGLSIHPALILSIVLEISSTNNKSAPPRHGSRLLPHIAGMVEEPSNAPKRRAGGEPFGIKDPKKLALFRVDFDRSKGTRVQLLL